MKRTYKKVITETVELEYSEDDVVEVLRQHAMAQTGCTDGKLEISVRHGMLDGATFTSTQEIES